MKSVNKGKGRPIEHAKSKTESVREDLTVASAELHLTNTTLEKSLPDPQKKGDVRKALNQAGVVEQKMDTASKELTHVTELLEEEVAERHRLEERLARRG
jgi:molybdenum cofactor biosynthesis enzyme